MTEHRPQVLAQKNYQMHRDRLEAMDDLRDRFKYIHDVNLWGSDESQSGIGSTLRETEVLRRDLPRMLVTIGASSMLDIPCGDFQWMSLIDLPGIAYIGADIVTAMVDRNRERYEMPERRFLTLDLTADPLPNADVVFCRDCLVHLSYTNIDRAIANIIRSGAKWLLMTHFLEIETNSDISDGDWRPLNFMHPPFNFPLPHATIIENCREADGAFVDKALALWRFSDLPRR